MTIGVPKEIKAQENRVALLPSAAYQLIKRGHQSSSSAVRGLAPVILTAITSAPERRSWRNTPKSSPAPT